METVLMVAAAHGFSEPMVVDSGDGYQIHFRVDLPNDDESKAIIKSVLQAFAAIVDCERGHIDTSVCNAARLARLPGTFNRKGEHSPERPYRLSRIVIAPDDGILLVTDVAALRTFAA